MAEKKYYWLKLKEDFFESKRIKKLRKLAGGDTFTIIYLKMQLKSINSDGVLTFSGLEKTFAEELALDIDEKPEDVGLLLNYLSTVGLIETSDGVNFLLPYAKDCIGSETASAERKRLERSRKRDIVTTLSGQSPKLSQTCHTEIEKDIDIDIEKEKKEKKHVYGEYRHVLLSDSDMEKLKARFTDPEDLNRRISTLDKWIEEKGTKYKNHYLTINRWADKDEKRAAEGQAKSAQIASSYSMNKVTLEDFD